MSKKSNRINPDLNEYINLDGTLTSKNNPFVKKSKNSKISNKSSIKSVNDSESNLSKNNIMISHLINSIIKI